MQIVQVLQNIIRLQIRARYGHAFEAGPGLRRVFRMTGFDHAPAGREEEEELLDDFLPGNLHRPRLFPLSFPTDAQCE